MRPFRFGVVTRFAESRRAWTAKARRLEDAGFSTLLMSDHFGGERFGPPVALMAAADATTRLRVGTLVLGNDFRHPAVLAKEAATLDLLSDGRLELGMGAGWVPGDYDRTGLRLDRPGIRIDRLAESIAVLKGLWGDGPCTHHGEHYRVDGLEQSPKPVQRPHPPLLVGGAGARILRLAAEEADIVHVFGRFSPDGFSAADAEAASYRRKIDALRAMPRFEGLELGTNVFQVGPADRATIWENDSPPDDSPQILSGDVAHMIEQVFRWREECGISYFVLHSDADAGAFGPVVAALTGK